MYNEDYNEILDEIEKTPEYERYKKATEESLKLQREYYVSAGILFLAIQKIRDTNRQIAQWYNKKKALKEEEDYIASMIAGSTLSLEKLWRRKATEDYLKFVSQFAWSKEYENIKKLLWTETDFILTNERILKTIIDRAKIVEESVTTTTTKRFAKEIVKLRGKVSEQVLKWLADELVTKRAKLIIETETSAVTEYIRWEVASRNWVEYKTWITTKDERVCNICRPFHLERIRIHEFFWWAYSYPPVHNHCRCYCYYDYENIAYLVNKSEDKRRYYSDRQEVSVVNKEALWNGWNSIIWKDAVLVDFYKEISKRTYKKDYKSIAKEALAIMNIKFDNEDYLDMNAFRKKIEVSSINANDKLMLMRLSDTELLFVAAKLRLSETGYKQLMKLLKI